LSVGSSEWVRIRSIDRFCIESSGGGFPVTVMELNERVYWRYEYQLIMVVHGNTQRVSIVKST
jgi:hypothetical protein